jgi:hypothetical protein
MGRFRKAIDTEGRVCLVLRELEVARPGWVPEEASSAQPSLSLAAGYKGKAGFQSDFEICCICLNAGLMKPWDLSWPGRKNWGRQDMRIT